MLSGVFLGHKVPQKHPTPGLSPNLGERPGVGVFYTSTKVSIYFRWEMNHPKIPIMIVKIL